MMTWDPAVVGTGPAGSSAGSLTTTPTAVPEEERAACES